jgi:coenzyme PQQ synthesis protein D (PqqD)
MNAELAGNVILQPTPWCTIREQEERYLVYNSRTDELHLVPPTGFYVFSLCDGLNTVDEIQTRLEKVLAGDSAPLRPRLQAFLAGLLERGILEVADET